MRQHTVALKYPPFRLVTLVPRARIVGRDPQYRRGLVETQALFQGTQSGPTLKALNVCGNNPFYKALLWGP